MASAAAQAGVHGRGAGESTPLTKSAYVSMHERVFMNTKPGGTAGADDDRIRTALVPAIVSYCVG